MDTLRYEIGIACSAGVPVQRHKELEGHTKTMASFFKVEDCEEMSYSAREVENISGMARASKMSFYLHLRRRPNGTTIAKWIGEVMYGSEDEPDQIKLIFAEFQL